jgi:Lysine-specific metallo-endopeptidase
MNATKFELHGELEEELEEEAAELELLFPRGRAGTREAPRKARLTDPLPYRCIDVGGRCISDGCAAPYKCIRRLGGGCECRPGKLCPKAPDPASGECLRELRRDGNYLVCCPKYYGSGDPCCREYLIPGRLRPDTKVEILGELESGLDEDAMELEPNELNYPESESQTENKFNSCSVAQKNKIQAAFVSAQKALNNAAAVLGTAYGKGRMDRRTAQLLNKHFHTTDRDDVREIFRYIFRIGQAFKKGLDFECSGYCSPAILGLNTCGYAWKSQWFGGYRGYRGRIHICFDNRPNTCSFWGLTDQEKAAVIIHEAAHRYVGIGDKVYAWENPRTSTRDYSRLTPKQAMDNADSYAWFCMELY